MAFTPTQGYRNRTQQRFPMYATGTITQGDAVVLVLSTGFVRVATGAAGEKFIGWANETVTGGSSNGDTSIEVNTGPTIKTQVTITGSGSGGALADADMGKTVYVTAANTYTTVTGDVPCGVVAPVNPVNAITSATQLSNVSGTGPLVGAIDFGGYNGNGVGGAFPVMPVNFVVPAASIPASGNLITGYKMPFAGRIVGFRATTAALLTATGDTADLNLEIGGTNVTGGVLTISKAGSGPVGTFVEATAITANDTFAKDALLDVEASASGTTFTGGTVTLEILLMQTGQ